MTLYENQSEIKCSGSEEYHDLGNEYCGCGNFYVISLKCDVI